MHEHLGAILERLHAEVDGWVAGTVEVDLEDVQALLAAYDAQAARLAAVDTRLHSRIAECCGAQLGQRSCESFGCPDLQEIRDLLATSGAEAQATRLAALVQAARDVNEVIDYAYDQASACEREQIDAFQAAVAALDAPPGETRGADAP